MKTIKIILATITVLIIIFFTTGLLIKETSYTTSVEINKPIEKTFALFTDKSNLQEWIPEFIALEIINENEGKTGSTYKMIIDNDGQEVIITEKIVAYVPNEKITFYFNADSMLKTDDYTFTRKNNSTKITKNSSCKSDSYIMSCIFPYYKASLRNIDQTYLDNFKAFAEKQ